MFDRSKPYPIRSDFNAIIPASVILVFPLLSRALRGDPLKGLSKVNQKQYNGHMGNIFKTKITMKILIVNFIFHYIFHYI